MEHLGEMTPGEDEEDVLAIAGCGSQASSARKRRSGQTESVERPEGLDEELRIKRARQEESRARATAHAERKQRMEADRANAREKLMRRGAPGGRGGKGAGKGKGPPR